MSSTPPPSPPPSPSNGPKPLNNPGAKAAPPAAAGPSDPPAGAAPPPAGGPGPARGFNFHNKSIAQGVFERIVEALPHLKTFHAKTTAWVTRTGWGRLGLLALVLVIAVQIIGDILGVDEPVVVVGPNPKDLSINVHEDDNGVTLTPTIDGKPAKSVKVPMPPLPPGAPAAPAPPSQNNSGINVDDHGLRFENNGKRITIDENGVHVEPATGAIDSANPANADEDETAAERAKDAASRAKDMAEAAKDRAEAAKEAAQARKEQEQEFREDVQSAISDAKSDLADSVSEAVKENQRVVTKKHADSALWGFFKVLMVLALAYLGAIKVASNTKRRADAMVKSAVGVAEHESLQRQLLEARLQTMQAQVEPHFLFNTLASVDYLIETDPARASMMQKNLIQYLRAAMPQMREASTYLGREVDLISAYLEILKVRMEERLQVYISVPNGLRSADFPPMMLQSLVENAIKHGLEPKAEGGSLTVIAEVVDGNLHVTVADSGLGFAVGGAPTSGGGVGLSNIRERLQLLYPGRGRLEISANQPVGTRVSIVIPYLPVQKRSAPAPEEKKS